MPPGQISEKAFQSRIVDYARLSGWLVYHTFDSRRSQPGFPDLVMVRGPELIFAEVKTDTGKLHVTQSTWIDALSRVGAALTAIDEKNDVTPVGVYVWRPSAWDAIVGVLSRRHTGRSGS
jgi:hypothetical protein